MGRLQDLAGKRFGRLVAVEIVSKKPTRWLCKCDCGNDTSATTMNLNSGNVKSCGCLSVEKSKERNTTHGMTNTKEYNAWICVKQRCYDKNHENYEYYGGRGIVMSEKLKNDFNDFYKEIGPMPDGVKKYTVERINNNVGYVEGNIMWKEQQYQSRNRRKMKNNTSGVTGVRLLVTKRSEGYVSRWMECGVGKLKYFSIAKYGLLPAFAMACAYRDEQIARLNSLGYNYSEEHGK